MEILILLIIIGVLLNLPIGNCSERSWGSGDNCMGRWERRIERNERKIRKR